MSRSAALVGPAESASGNDNSVGPEPVDGSVAHIEANDSLANVSLHNQVQDKVLNEEGAIITKGSPEESVQHRVAGSVGHCTAAVGLASLSVVKGLPSKGPLVDLSLLRSREGHSIRLEL